MSQSQHYDIRERAEWIARLLWAPDQYGNTNSPIFGRTRLMKAAFLIDRKLEEEFGVSTAFDFEPHKYGPFDKDVYTAVTFLENQDHIKRQDPEEHGQTYDLVKYELTPSGETYARNLYEGIPEQQQELIRWVKTKHAMKKLGRLLTYVYNQYPEMTTESELV